MKITRADVTYVAQLARIDLSDEAIEMFAGQIGDILDYVDLLKQVPTEGVAPTSHAISLTNAFREDVVSGPSDPDTSLANAPEREAGYFIVPKVIG
jgi:aspartyl-tRNA(Asn)/glutamyl-tRNA(Gln) amidotransferase subunit C